MMISYTTKRSYSGGDWTVVIGAIGNRAVFVETAKASTPSNFLFCIMVVLLIPLSLLADDTYSKIGIRHLELL